MRVSLIVGIVHNFPAVALIFTIILTTIMMGKVGLFRGTSHYFAYLVTH